MWAFIRDKQEKDQKRKQTWQMRTQGLVEEAMTCSQNVDLPLPGAPTNITTIGFPFVSSPLNNTQ